MVKLNYIKGIKIHGIKQFVTFLFGDIVVKSIVDSKSWHFKLYVKKDSFNTDSRKAFKDKFEDYFKGVKLIEIE